MPTTYLQIVQTITDELGLNRPAIVVNSTDLQIRQIGAMVNRELRELQQNYEWTALQTEFDLRVAAPVFLTGDTTSNSQVIANVTGIPTAVTDDPSLFLVSGQSIVVDSRLTAADSGALTLTMDQPATGTNVGIALTISRDTYPEPGDFDRFINQTWWDRTNRWALIGPDSPQVDQWHRSGIVSIGPRRHFRQIGYNNLSSTPSPIRNYRIWPAPGATDTPIDLVYEYISANCVLSNSGVARPTFQADDDFPVLDANMLILGAKWRMWQIKGFDYAAMQEEAIDYVNRKYAQDGGAKTLSMVGSRVGLYQSLVQDGNYPGTAAGGT